MQRRTPRQEAARVLEHAALVALGIEEEADAVALAHRAVGRLDDRRFAIALGDDQVDGRRRHADAVGHEEADVLVRAGGGVARYPGEPARDRVERRAGRQVVGPERERVAVDIERDDVELDRPAFAALDVRRESGEFRRGVPAGHVEHEALERGRTPAVEDLQRDGFLGTRTGARRPRQQARQRIDGHAVGAGEELEHDGLPVRIGRDDLELERLPDGRAGRRRRRDGRGAIQLRRGRDAGREVDAPMIGRRDRDGAPGRRRTRGEPAVRRKVRREIDHPAAVVGAAGRIGRNPGVTVARIECEHGRQHEIGVAGVRDRDVVRDGAERAVEARESELHVEVRGEIADRREGRRVVAGERLSEDARHIAVDRERVRVGQELTERQQCRAVLGVVLHRLHDLRTGTCADEAEVRGVQHALRKRCVAREHVLVEHHRQEGQRQRDRAARRRIRRDDGRCEHGVQHVDLVRLADEQAPVGRPEDDVAARAAGRDGDATQRRDVDHREFGSARGEARVGDRARVVRHEQQPFERRALAAERDRVDVGIELDHHLGALLFGEAHDLPAIGPRDGPQFAFVVEREAADTQVAVAAVLRERARRRIEDLHAAVRRHVDAIGVRLDRERDRHAVAEAV